MSGDNDLLDLARRVVDRATGGEQVEAYATHAIGTSVTVFDGEVETLTSSETRGVGVRVIVDGRLGFASTSDVSEDGLTYALEEARSNAAYGTPDIGNVLPLPRDTSDLSPMPSLVSKGFDDVPVARKVAMAVELERLTRAADSRVSGVAAAVYGDSLSRGAVASTAGINAAYSRTDAYAYVSALARAGDETQTGLGLSMGRGAGDLDLEAAGREGALRATRLLGATKPATASVPVVFDPIVTATFLGVLADAFSAESVQKGRSLLAGKIGELVAGTGLSIIDDGRLPEGPGSAPFDDEGVPTGRTVLVHNGELMGWLHNTETAARAGDASRSTGNAARAGHSSTPGVASSNLYLSGTRPRSRRSCAAPAPGSTCRTSRASTPGSTRSQASSASGQPGCGSATGSWPNRSARSPSRRPSSACSRPSWRSATTGASCPSAVRLRARPCSSRA